MRADAENSFVFQEHYPGKLITPFRFPSLQHVVNLLPENGIVKGIQLDIQANTVPRQQELIMGTVDHRREEQHRLKAAGWLQVL
jgi:hypothetical protein